MNNDLIIPSHGRGHRFDPCIAHQQLAEIVQLSFIRRRALSAYSGEREPNTARSGVRNPCGPFSARSLPSGVGDRP